jgi:hypothetical protein
MFKSTEVKVPKVKWRYSATVLSKLQEKFQTFQVGRGFQPYTWVKLKCSFSKHAALYVLFTHRLMLCMWRTVS